MARKARIKSSTGIYHVLVRAIADLPLFSDEEDTQFYTNILNDLQLQGRCEVYAYALFPTHVHLLIREGVQEDSKVQGVSINTEFTDNSRLKEEQSSLSLSSSSSSSLSEPIGSIMKRLASAYSYFFNVKYDHYGPIYQDRFKSNPVESRDYYLKVLNHIGSQHSECKYTCHHIPSGLSINHTPSSINHTPSSINHTPSSINHKPSTINPKPSTINPRMLDYYERPKRITDSRLLAYLQQNHSFTNIGEFLQREVEEQKEVISSCKKIGGSIRQIVRLTGCPYQAVFHVRV